MFTHSTQEKLEIVESAYNLYKEHLITSPNPSYICTSITWALRNKFYDSGILYNYIVDQHYIPLFIHHKPENKNKTFPWWPLHDEKTRKAVFEEMIETLKQQLQDETK